MKIQVRPTYFIHIYIYIYNVGKLHTHIDKTITLITHVSENFMQFSYMNYMLLN